MTHVLLDDDRANHQRLLLAMLGRLDPSIWQDAIKRRQEVIGHIGNLQSVEAVISSLDQAAAKNTEIRTRLETAQRLVASIDQEVTDKHYPAALNACTQAEQLLREAYCLAQPGRGG